MGIVLSKKKLLEVIARKGILPVFKFISKKLEDKNLQIKDDGTTLLHLAAKNGRYKVCVFISENTKNPNPPNEDGWTPLHLAAESGHFKVYKYIWGNCDAKNPSANNNLTPLHLAARKGHFKICQFIIQSIEDKNPSNHCLTPLHLAAKFGHFEICLLIMKYIKDKNPAVNTTKHSDVTPLHSAAVNGHLNVCQLIMKYLEDKNPRFSNGRTPLHLAAHHGHFKICKYILNNIVDKNPNDDFGITPLEIADSNNKTEVCQLITENNALPEYFPTNYQSYFWNGKTRDALINLINFTKMSQISEKWQHVGICNGLTGFGSILTLIANNYSSKVKDNDYWKKLRSTIISQNSVKIEFNCFQTNPKYFIDILSPDRLPLITTKSIQIAYAYAKTFVKKLDPSNNILSQNLYLNMSAIIGNYFVLINGPSAGCTFVTVFISFALQKPVNRNLAMTGMISSTGKIGSVGAISEKVSAAFKAGLTNVIIPEANKTDFELLPSRIKDNLKIHYAKTYKDIYKLAFESHL